MTNTFIFLTGISLAANIAFLIFAFPLIGEMRKVIEKQISKEMEISSTLREFRQIIEINKQQDKIDLLLEENQKLLNDE